VPGFRRVCVRGHIFAEVGRTSEGRCAGCSAVRLEQHRAAGRKCERRRKGVANPTDEKRAGPCEICGASVQSLQLDHDHITGRTRGWLCPLCNRGLGKFRDNPQTLRRAAEYLESK
jgi:hypothetical protein